MITLRGKGGTGGGGSDDELSNEPVKVGVDVDARGDRSASERRTSLPFIDGIPLLAKVPFEVDIDGALRIVPSNLLPIPAVGVLGEEVTSEVVEGKGLLVLGIAIVTGVTLGLSGNASGRGVEFVGGGSWVKPASPSEMELVLRPGGKIGVCWYGSAGDPSIGGTEVGNVSGVRSPRATGSISTA